MPHLLVEECGLSKTQAKEIGEDILARANYLAALNVWQHRPLVAPFMEEVAGYDPRSAPWEHKAAVSVVVRSSLLEEAHVSGQVKADHLRALTTVAVQPVAGFIAATTNIRFEPPGHNPFADLYATYPRAWACLTALRAAIDQGGGRVGYQEPEAPVPLVPTASEHADAKPDSQHEGAVIFSAIDPRFDQQLISMLTAAIQHQAPIFVPTLSRFSRNLDKLLRVIELLLARGVTIVTTNYLLRPGEVWVRRHHIVQPDNHDPLDGLRNTTGLSGVHRNVVERIVASLS